MKYMLMMHAPRGTGDYQISEWSPEDFRTHIAFMHGFNEDLTASGEWVDVQGLAAPGQAKLIRAGKDGAPATDGPFAEAKEFLAGFWIVDVDTPERAYQLAARASAAPGPGAAEAWAASSKARSGESTSTSQKPARNSFVSGNGPSVLGAPSFPARTSFASAGAESPCASTHSPEAARSAL